MKVGDVGRASVVVSESHYATAVGSGSVSVFSTPSLIALAEKAACDAIRCDELETSVGVHVTCAHVATAVAGDTVIAECKIEAIEKRKVVFSWEAFEEQTKQRIGHGTHERVVVNKERFAAKANEKKKQ